METLSFREPIVTFVILLAVILTMPPLFERLRLPGIVGLLAAGIILGSGGFNLLSSDSETIRLLSDIGKIYLMFVAGLEIDLEQFRQTRNRSLGFGSATFAIPLIAGILVGRVFGFDWNAAVLIGSLLASHTLLAYPIVRRLGVVGDEAVTVTIGATIFTDIGALVVLAICVGVSQGDFSTTKLLVLLGSLTIYALVTLLGLDRLGKAFFRRSKNDEGNQFLFVLLAVFLASVGAEVIGVEKIIGAFLAGLAVNDVLGESPVKEKVEFVGSVLFIPIFFVDMGLLLDLKGFVANISAIALSLTIVGALVSSKLLAALLAQWLYRYNWQQTLTMWSLSLPQVAATLAAALVGYQEEILNAVVLNSIIFLMLVTAVMGPVITARSAARLGTELPSIPEKEQKQPRYLTTSSTPEAFTVVVPVANPRTERYLMEMAMLLAKSEGGQIVPLAIARSQGRMDDPQMEKRIQRSQALLATAQAWCQEWEVNAAPQMRIEFEIAPAIAHGSREVNASLILLGMSNRVGFRARLFGSITDSILWSAHCLVVIARLQESPLTMQRILVPVANLAPAALRPIRLALILAAGNQAEVTLLHVCSASTSEGRKAWIRDQLSLVVKNLSPSVRTQIEIIPQANVTGTLIKAARRHDLVVLRSQRQRVGYGLALGERTTPLLQQLSGSVVLLGEPSGTASSRLWGSVRGKSLSV